MLTHTSVHFALSGFTLHYGIALLQNINFLLWWGPTYTFLLMDPVVWALNSGACPRPCLEHPHGS